jgi:hypothetical protein
MKSKFKLLMTRIVQAPAKFWFRGSLIEVINLH